MTEPIVFYDIDRKVTPNEARAWNPNCWKTRYTLNIKGIPYRTVWVEYPVIKPLLLKIGAPAAEKLPDGTPLYTLPTIYDPNTKKAVTDSAAIARYLDATYPTHGPRLIAADTDVLHTAFQVAYQTTLFEGKHVASLALPASHEIMNEPSAAYFKTTREAFFGPLAELAPKGSEKRKAHWEGFKTNLGKVAEWFGADGKDKVLFSGDEGGKIVYADIVVAAQLRWMRAVFQEDSEEWKDIMSWDGGRWKRLMEVFSKYEAVDEGSVAEL
uniref:Thiol-transferase Tc52 n=1 Tax=Ganoderma boninense TaxID=34458 RepID=A0A5K1JT30_9APHY